MSLTETVFGPVPSDPKSLRSWESVIHYAKPILEHYRDPEVTEIMINGWDSIFIEKNSRMIRIEEKFASESDLQRFITQCANALNLVDPHKDPETNARLPDASRICATMPAITPFGATVTLRKAPTRLLTLEDLVSYGAMSAEMADFIGEQVSKRVNFLCSGNTGSGKTTLLRAVSKFLDPSTRIITAEDTMELHLRTTLPNCISMEASKQSDGVPKELSDLIRISLRQRPDSLWVGELRDAKAVNAWVTAMNTGLDGCASTIHSNGPADSIHRCQYLMASAGVMDYDLVGKILMGDLHMLIHASRNHRLYGRKITHVCLIQNGKIVPVFEYNIEKGEHIYLKPSC
ncbi:TPA: ATPase, T2SS/T4P/T4SS family [Pseudomonas aeruginosa]|uniref:CpaF family protein n=1 Tax=Pseudomonas aeruginosa group TaxID=136841 RepID=UPI001CD5B3DF|nr:ATPase, T2SS/T4P/T4SS family [Pseudomonas aeruginosa]BDG78234.1 T4SS protein [Pseudomonas aeruginosa]HBO9009063.1 CpaF family protein [Pseudomonas aeruginosa]HBO9230345.1 CpaF family protein [Pseudomonas aeruginosa]HCT8044139.1 CpaF family protein [Pseudomonas aeruginosa]